MLAGHDAVERAGSTLLPRVSQADAAAAAQAAEQATQPAAQQQEQCIDPPGKIRSNLYIGSKETEASLAALQAAGITHILQAGGELRPSHPQHYTYLHLSVSDEEDEDLVAAFKEAFEFIEEGRKKGACWASA